MMCYKNTKCDKKKILDNFLIIKLAIKNMTRSIKDYTIYFLTLVLGVAIFYMFNSLDSQQAMLEVSRSTHEMVTLLISMLGFVSVFVAIV